MKKLFSAIATLLVLCVLSYNTVFAQNYTYFDITETNYPEDSIISDNVTCVGGVYYMSKRDGGLFYSHDAKSWHFIDGSDGAKIISDKKRFSDSLIVFYNGYLAKSYDGAEFTLLHTFSLDTVIHYNNGIYTAFEKDAQETGAYVSFSFDAENWIRLTDERVLDGRFTVNQYSNMYIINGINTSGKTSCALIDYNSNVHILPYDYVCYDAGKKIYAAIKKDSDTVGLYYSDSLDKPFTQIALPHDITTLASYYDGCFYIATVYDDNFYDVYKCSDTANWKAADKFYMPLYKTVDENGAFCEVFLWHTCIDNIIGTSVLKTDENGNLQHSSVMLANGLKLNMYGSVLGVTASDKPVNLLSADGLCWHQADEASAFSILNSYSLRGDYMFVDRTTDHTVLRPKGNPYENLEQKGIEVRIDGHYVAFDQPPMIINDRTMVPLRAIAESLGAIVNYNADTKTITMTKGNDTIIMTIGAETARIMYYDGAVYEPTLDSPAVIINDRTLVPIRFIGEAFNKTVEWEAGSKTVWITSR